MASTDSMEVKGTVIAQQTRYNAGYLAAMRSIVRRMPCTVQYTVLEEVGRPLKCERTEGGRWMIDGGWWMVDGGMALNNGGGFHWMVVLAIGMGIGSTQVGRVSRCRCRSDTVNRTDRVRGLGGFWHGWL